MCVSVCECVYMPTLSLYMISVTMGFHEVVWVFLCREAVSTECPYMARFRESLGMRPWLDSISLNADN